jgi:hypothetical protein
LVSIVVVVQTRDARTCVAVRINEHSKNGEGAANLRDMADAFVDNGSVGRHGITSYDVYFSRGLYKGVRVRIPSRILKNKIVLSHLEQVLDDATVGELEMVAEDGADDQTFDF